MRPADMRMRMHADTRAQFARIRMARCVRLYGCARHARQHRYGRSRCLDMELLRRISDMRTDVSLPISQARAHDADFRAQAHTCLVVVDLTVGCCYWSCWIVVCLRLFAVMLMFVDTVAVVSALVLDCLLRFALVCRRDLFVGRRSDICCGCAERTMLLDMLLFSTRYTHPVRDAVCCICYVDLCYQCAVVAQYHMLISGCQYRTDCCALYAADNAADRQYAVTTVCNMDWLCHASTLGSSCNTRIVAVMQCIIIVHLYHHSDIRSSSSPI